MERAKTYKETWERRKENLPFKSYRDFLESDYWARVKKKASKRDNYQRCDFCRSMDNIELHHKHYEFIGEKHELSAVIAVCRQHHQFIHDLAENENISVYLATRICYKIMKKGRQVPISYIKYKENRGESNNLLMTPGKYLYRKEKQNTKAHIWMPAQEDTLCKMWSTGGLKQGLRDWVIKDNRNNRDVCGVCLQNLNSN